MVMGVQGTEEAGSQGTSRAGGKVPETYPGDFGFAKGLAISL